MAFGWVFGVGWLIEDWLSPLCLLAGALTWLNWTWTRRRLRRGSARRRHRRFKFLRDSCALSVGFPSICLPFFAVFLFFSISLFYFESASSPLSSITSTFLEILGDSRPFAKGLRRRSCVLISLPLIEDWVRIICRLWPIRQDSLADRYGFLWFTGTDSKVTWFIEIVWWLRGEGGGIPQRFQCQLRGQIKKIGWVIR